jgi:YD repeat-containing protein
MLRSASLDEFIDHLGETYEHLSPEALQAFKDQVIALGQGHGPGITLQYEYDANHNTITVSVADIPRQRN